MCLLFILSCCAWRRVHACVRSRGLAGELPGGQQRPGPAPVHFSAWRALRRGGVRSERPLCPMTRQNRRQRTGRGCCPRRTKGRHETRTTRASRFSEEQRIAGSLLVSAASRNARPRGTRGPGARRARPRRDGYTGPRPASDACTSTPAPCASAAFCSGFLARQNMFQHARARTSMHTRARTHMCTHAHKRARTHTCTRIRAHTHAHRPVPFPLTWGELATPTSYLGTRTGERASRREPPLTARFPRAAPFARHVLAPGPAASAGHRAAAGNAALLSGARYTTDQGQKALHREQDRPAGQGTSSLPAGRGGEPCARD